MMLKKIALAALAVLAASSAQALEFTCAGSSQVFASRAEARASAREADPVARISVRVWEDEDGARMSVGHIARSGRVFDRSEQYPMSRVERTTHGFRWRGVYDRDPRITMVGTLRIDRRDVLYTETRLREGEVEWQAAAQCEVAD